MKIESDTFKKAWELSAPGSTTEEYFMRIRNKEFFCGPHHPHLDLFPDYREISKEELPAGVTSGYEMTTVTIDTPRYLHYLASRFTNNGGRIARGSVQHIQQILEGGEGAFMGGRSSDQARAPPGAVVVCTGLGSRFLGGVEDKTVYPIRGQTVLLNAPWIKYSATRTEADGSRSYVIPRRSGNVILGGTYEADDWFPRARPEMTRFILERNLQLCPELAPPEVLAQREPTIEDLLPLVIEDGCGLRPGREEGIRLEVELFETKNEGKKVPVIFNYGHGSYGFQSSWGSAAIALELLENALKPP